MPLCVSVGGRAAVPRTQPRPHKATVATFPKTGHVLDLEGEGAEGDDCKWMSE